MGALINPANNIITHLYVNASKSVRELIADFYENKQYSNNFKIIDNLIIFDKIKLILDFLNSNKPLRYMTLTNLYKYSIDNKILANLIAIFFYKFRTITQITITEEDETIKIRSPYKEFARKISYPEDADFTHFLTITYSHKTKYSVFTIPEDSQAFEIMKIFETMQHNKKVIEKVNRGIHRLRSYIRKRLRDELKKKIKDREELNKKVSGLMHTVFRYFKVYELHKTGHLHAHILIKLPDFITKKDFKEIIKKMSNWFDTAPQGIDLKRLKNPKDKKNAQRYALKYMFKQFNDNNLVYVETEKKEKIYILKKEALIRNDIPRMISKSRNVKTKRFKPSFKFKREKNTEKKKKAREITRIQRELKKRHYQEFKNYLKEFKTARDKKLEFEIEKAEKRTEKLGKLRDFLDGRYYSIRDIMQILDDFRNDEIIQERFYTEYQQALYKFLRLSDELEKERREEIEIIDF